MVGFSGAVEDGARATGIVIALVVAVIVGWVFRSYGTGLVVFLVGYAGAVLWGHLAGERFRAQLLEDMAAGEDETPGDSDT